MKRLIIILACTFVSAALIFAQTDSTQTPAPATTQKTSATTAKTGVAKTAPVHKTTTSKTGTTTAARKTTTTTTAGQNGNINYRDS